MDVYQNWLIKELKALRRERALRQKDLSSSCGKPAYWWGNVECGRSDPPIDDIDLAAGALGYELHVMAP